MLMIQKKKKKNRVTERETKYLYEKTELETITSLFVSIATILKPQAWNYYVQVNGNAILLWQHKYICNMHLHVLFCQRRFALLFPNPTSASLATAHVRAATVILYTVPVYTTWFAPNLWICEGNEIGYLDMPTQLVYKITFSLFMASWSQFTHHLVT